MDIDKQIFTDYCSLSSKVVDVGAQSGEFLKIGNETMKGGKIYSIEPDIKYLDKLKEIQPLNGNEIIDRDWETHHSVHLHLLP